MLQSMREGAQSTAAKVIIGLIVISFAGFGLESLLPGGSGTSVAEVNGEEITPQALQQAITLQKQRLSQIFGEQIDPAMLDDDRLRPAALESLIQRALLLQESQALGLTVSDAEIGRAVTSMQAFQVDGQFNPDQYRRVLATSGFTPESFRRAQAEDLMLTQLQTSLLASEFVTPLEQQAAANVSAEARDVRFIEVPESALVAENEITPEAVSAYYEANPEQFMEPLKLIAEYVYLSADDYIEPVPEAQLLEEFEAVRDDYVVKEQARVAHILLTQADDESDADYLQRIAQVEVSLAADDADFAALAGEYSDDIGSSAFGGELGFTDGEAFPEPMEEAIALLEPGQVSAPVETDAGTHFILLQERQAGEEPSFESIRPELEYSIQTAEAQRQLLLDTDVLRDLAFNAEDLAEPSDAIGATIARSEPFSVAEGSGLFNNPLLRDAAFAPDVLDDGNNSELIEIGENEFVLLRVAERIEPQRLSIESVTDVIRDRLLEDAEREALASLIDRVQSELDNGGTVEAVAVELGYEWKVELGATRLGSQLPREVLQTAFDMRASGAGTIQSVPMPGTGYALVQLARVTPGSTAGLSEAQLQSLTRQTTSEFQRATFDEYSGALRTSATIVTR